MRILCAVDRFATRALHSDKFKRVLSTADDQGSFVRLNDLSGGCWFMGYNPNLPGRQKRTFMLYAGGAPQYRDTCDDVAANDYKGMTLTRG